MYQNRFGAEGCSFCQNLTQHCSEDCNAQAHWERYGLAFAELPIRFLLSPAKMDDAGEERGDLNVQLYLSVGSVTERLNLR